MLMRKREFENIGPHLTRHIYLSRGGVVGYSIHFFTAPVSFLRCAHQGAQVQPPRYLTGRRINSYNTVGAPYIGVKASPNQLQLVQVGHSSFFTPHYQRLYHL